MFSGMTQENPQTFDLAVIGAGPGGYPAAIKAAQKGLSVALIEAKEVGGTCLNRGCIPSKALIANAEAFQNIQHAELFGINVQGVTIDYDKMVQQKDKTVGNLRKGVETLISTNGIHLFRGYARFISPREIKITGPNAAIIHAEKTIIATGSEPRQIPAFPCDGNRIHDSTTLLEMKKLPKSLIVIGGGVIGCEFASLYNALGVQVTILEMLPKILSTECPEISQTLTQALTKKGIKIQTGIAVASVTNTGSSVKVELQGKEPLEAEIALVAVGRAINTSDIGLDKAGLLTNDQGFIPVNDKMETNVKGIYAIGDITSRWWLAHVATHQGIIAAENAARGEVRMHYNAIPSVIFTQPEAASVGLCLDKALEKGYQAVVGAFPFQALGKSQASQHTEGFAQIVIDKRTGQILGAQVVGYDAATLIAQMATAITNELTIECLTETIHAHPTLPEAWMEAGFLVNNSPLHLPPRPKRKS